MRSTMRFRGTIRALVQQRMHQAPIVQIQVRGGEHGMDSAAQQCSLLLILCASMASELAC